MTNAKTELRKKADLACAAIDKRIAEKRVLLDAMKRGALQ